MFGRTGRKLLAISAAATVASVALLGSPRAAHAQSAPGTGEVSSTGKGIVGGALLGGEVVDITMAIIGVQSAWPYFVIGGVGAIGGGIAGHFVEAADTGGHAEPSVYMLAGGMALFIPALVASLNATSYKPPETDQTEPLQNQPAGEPPAAKGSISVTSQLAPKKKPRPEAFAAHIPTSLVDLHTGRIALGLPAFELRPTYTHQEMAMYGVEQHTEVRVPLFQASF
jgi:hypothetical protein